MTTLPADALGLATLVFLLGLRHGFDPTTWWRSTD